jgi:Transposase DDE domain
VSVCPVVPSDVLPSAVEAAGLELLGGAGMVAVRLGDLRSPARVGLGKDGRTALVAAGAGRIRTGDVVVFFKPVAVARAVVRGDGRVQAGGHLADHVRVGVAEQQLDTLTGTPGLIDDVAASVELAGRVKGKARRAMTPALAVRFTLLMTLMPDADYPEVLAALLGDLASVPWQRPYQTPTATVVSTWRQAIGPEPLEQLRDRVLAAVGAEHHERDWRAVQVGDLQVCSIDGSLVRTPDTPANRQAFGSAGTADDSAPYPQLRELRCVDASTRATLAVVCGPSGAAAGGERDKGEAEQVLLDKALSQAPGVFTPERVWVMDRNFPGVPRIARMLAAGTHVLIRLKDGIKLPRQGEFARDHSYLATISGGGTTLTMRVVEYTISIDGTDTPELFCLITDLLDPDAYPAKPLANAYHWRWIGSETTLKEAKSTINGAGPSTGAILRSATPALINQEHAAWTTAVELTRAVARAAATTATPAKKGRRAGKPVQPREISFTAARRAVITTTRTGAATASLPTPLTTANHQTTLTELARRRVILDRDRHRERKTKARPGFPHAAAHPPTHTAPAEITICKPQAA